MRRAFRTLNARRTIGQEIPAPCQAMLKSLKIPNMMKIAAASEFLKKSNEVAYMMAVIQPALVWALYDDLDKVAILFR